MRFSTISTVSLLSLSLPFAAVGATHGNAGRHHDSIARRSRGDVDVHKRDSFSNARFTFYDVGLGSCGQNNVPSDFIVALNTPMYGDGYPGPHCFKSITIQWGGKTTTATIMDECPGCPYAGLDMSRGLFDFFADESVGVLYGTWWYNDGSGGGDAPPATSSPPPPPPPPPTTTAWIPIWTPEPTPTPTPTTHHTTSSPPPPPPPPSTTWTPPPSTSSTSTWVEPSSSKVSSSSSSWVPPPSSSSHSSSATPSSSSAAPSPTVLDTIQAANQAFIGITGLLVAGAGAAQ